MLSSILFQHQEDIKSWVDSTKTDGSKVKEVSSKIQLLQISAWNIWTVHKLPLYIVPFVDIYFIPCLIQHSICVPSFCIFFPFLYCTTLLVDCSWHSGGKIQLEELQFQSIWAASSIQLCKLIEFIIPLNDSNWSCDYAFWMICLPRFMWKCGSNWLVEKSNVAFV